MMSKDYVTHWVLGVLCSVIWFWGDRAGLPAAAVQLAATIVPVLLGHAVAFTPDAASPNDQALATGVISAAPSQQP